MDNRSVVKLLSFVYFLFAGMGIRFLSVWNAGRSSRSSHISIIEVMRRRLTNLLLTGAKCDFLFLEMAIAYALLGFG